MKFDLGTLDSVERSLPFGLLVLRNKKSPEIIIETTLTAHKLNTMIKDCYRVRQLMFKSVCDRDKDISL